MISVSHAEQIIQSRIKDYGTELVPFESALGRVLAAALLADRDLPPFNRATMDGIAIRYADWESGIRSYQIAGIQAAGAAPVEWEHAATCVEIMTGAALPVSADTVVRYEDLELRDGKAMISGIQIKQGQNIHVKGSDKQQQEVLVPAGEMVTPAVISIAASVGTVRLQVRRQPRIAILTTGDELIAPEEQPGPYQIRRSNGYAIQAALQQLGIRPLLLHLPDDAAILQQQIGRCLADHDVLLLSGGISMGKFDYLNSVLHTLQVQQLFHRVQQRPGKPFWFGEHAAGALVFAFPGNPVSAFMCLHRYFIPWLKSSEGATLSRMHALLETDFIFKPALQYFLAVRLRLDEGGRLLARPVAGNGSGDFASLAAADAFMELPLEKEFFAAGTPFPIWPFKSIF